MDIDQLEITRSKEKQETTQKSNTSRLVLISLLFFFSVGNNN